MIERALQICEETAANRELIEVRDFLRWLVQGGFVFLGYRHYLREPRRRPARFTLESGTELGIMREHDESRFRSPVPLDEISPARRKLFFDGPPLVIGKTRVESQVHRRAPDGQRHDSPHRCSGSVAGFDHFVGLFTSKAYAEEAQHIPDSARQAARGARGGGRGRRARTTTRKSCRRSTASPRTNFFARRLPSCARSCASSSTSRAKPRCGSASLPICAAAT